jgi:hypothetical protein
MHETETSEAAGFVAALAGGIAVSLEPKAFAGTKTAASNTKIASLSGVLVIPPDLGHIPPGLGRSPLSTLDQFGDVREVSSARPARQ